MSIIEKIRNFFGNKKPSHKMHTNNFDTVGYYWNTDPVSPSHQPIHNAPHSTNESYHSISSSDDLTDSSTNLFDSTDTQIDFSDTSSGD